MITIREMDIVGRGLLGKRDKNNPFFEMSFSNIRNNIWRRRKSKPISVKHSVNINLERKKHFLAHNLKAISNVLSREEFKGLNGIIGRHGGQDVMFVNDNHHFCFSIQTREGHLSMVPFVNRLTIDEINDYIKKCILYCKTHEEQWLYIKDHEKLQEKGEKYFPTLAITDWHSIGVDSGFLPLMEASVGPPLTFVYTRKELFVVYDHLFFSGAIIGSFLNAIRDEISK